MKPRATYDDVLNAPEDKVAEILEGELYLSPRPGPRHAVAATRLAVLLGSPFDHGRGGPGGWWIIAEPELHLREHVVVPDMAGWRRTRMPALPDEASSPAASPSASSAFGAVDLELAARWPPGAGGSQP